MIVIRRLADVNQQQYVDKCNSLGINKCSYEIASGRTIQLPHKMASTT